MDLIDEQLTKFSHDHTLSPTICAGIAIAKQTLNRYYELTDSSDVYHIAMVESTNYEGLGYETVILNPPSSRVNDFSSKNRHYILTWESWTPRCTPILWVPKYPNFTC
jgi:hypothetical protein